MPKTAIITGSSKGIGRAIALRLARDGSQVVLCARTEDLLAVAVREIEAAGGRAASIPLDLRAAGSAARLVDFAIASFGAIDILVNNAGATKRGEFEELTEEDWVDGYALKLFGAVRLTRAAWPHLKKQSGSVINIAGIGGRTPGPQFTIGGSVNAALLSFTKAIADLGIRDGVQVNAVNPGAIRTERLARRLGGDEAAFVRASNIRRVGEPDDIANLVAFLVSSAGSFLQGSLIDIDGGQSKSL